MMTTSPTGETLSWLSSPATLVPSSDSQPDTAATGGNAVVAFAAVAVKQSTRSSSSRPSSSTKWKRPQTSSSSSESAMKVSSRRAISEEKRRYRSTSMSPPRRKLSREEAMKYSRNKGQGIGVLPEQKEEEPYYSFSPRSSQGSLSKPKIIQRRKSSTPRSGNARETHKPPSGKGQMTFPRGRPKDHKLGERH